MNAKPYPALLTLLLVAGCASKPELPTPPNVVEVKVPVAVPCIKDMPKRPEMAQARDNTRPEYMRALLINHARMKAYEQELEAIIETCRE